MPRVIIAGAGGVLVTLGLHGLGEVELELGQTVVEGFALEGARRNLARVGGAVVHGVEHGLHEDPEGVIAEQEALQFSQ